MRNQRFVERDERAPWVARAERQKLLPTEMGALIHHYRDDSRQRTADRSELSRPVLILGTVIVVTLSIALASVPSRAPHMRFETALSCPGFDRSQRVVVSAIDAGTAGEFLRRSYPSCRTGQLVMLDANGRSVAPVVAADRSGEGDGDMSTASIASGQR